MIITIGDIHGEFFFFHEMMRKFDSTLPITFIQVGDLGFWPDHIKKYWPKEFPWKVYFIDGNHEHFPSLIQYTEVTKVADNLFYIPRGTILSLENKRFAFMGGGFSLDKRYRTPNITWFPEEDVTAVQVNKLLDNSGKFDYLITHSPPYTVVRTHWRKVKKELWNLQPEDDIDFTLINLQRLWNGLGNPYLICGHMHKSIIGPNYRILNICEVYKIPDGDYSSIG